MPTISTFYGIIIQMFWNDHAPPHFHAIYGEFQGIIDINLLIMLEGNLPRRSLNLILDWAELHQEELLQDWELCTQKKTPHKIKGSVAKIYSRQQLSISRRNYAA